MEFKRVLQTNPDFAYVVDALEISSSVGRNALYSSVWYAAKDRDALQREYRRMRELSVFIQEGKTWVIEKLQLKISQILDIHPTFLYLKKMQGVQSSLLPLDDIQLFEIKRFILLVREISALTAQLPVGVETFPELDRPLSMLDPKGECLPSFFIYDEYSPELASLRALCNEKIKEHKQHPCPELEEAIEELRLREVEQEGQIRQQLTRDLLPWADPLMEAMRLVAYWDVLSAKVLLAHRWNLTEPALLEDGWKMSWKQLFNPVVKAAVEERGKNYQEVDVELFEGSALLTGANMSGKTVLLTSLTLAQIMVQFGFFVPASRAEISLFDEVVLLHEDEQNNVRGLSSFGSEMMLLDEAIRKVKQGQHLALFIDELARTTNPQEGKALVCAVLDLLQGRESLCLISSHYDGIGNARRRLRIKGFPVDSEGVTLDNIQDFMDYSVEEVLPETPIPMQALKIAEILGVDEELLAFATRYIS